jgi:tetratricopeptide (TPR) repeat protein
LNSYAKALVDNGEAEKAFNQFERALKRQPNEPMTSKNYGNALGIYANTLLSQGQIKKAFDRFEQALQIQPEHIKTLTSYGMALANQEQFEKAEQLLEQAFQIDPDNPIMLATYGVVLANHGQFENACQMFEHAQQIDPDNIVTLTNYGKALAYNKQFNHAFEQFQQALTLNPDDKITRVVYASVLEAAGDYQPAISQLLEILSKQPILPAEANSIHLKLGQLYHRTGQQAKSNQHIDLAIQNAPEADIGRLQAAKRLFSVEHYNEHAIKRLTEITAASPLYLQAKHLLLPNLGPKELFEMFNQQTEKQFKDTAMLNRSIYHKIQNEVSILKEIVYEIIANTHTDNILSNMLNQIEQMLDGIKSKRNNLEQTKIKQIPTEDYDALIATISQTAHDIVDYANNQLSILSEDIWEALDDLEDPTAPRYQGLEELQAQVKNTQEALDDLKSVNEGIKPKYTRFKVKDLFETWQNNPKLRNATIRLNIQNPETELYGDEPKIKSFLNELVENSLNHNPEQADLQIHINAQELEQTQTQRKPITPAKKHLIINYYDNGKGIPSDKKDWIFLPLKSTSSKSSGLGLFMIRRTLKEMKGTIREDGRQGVHFQIQIPYEEIE